MKKSIILCIIALTLAVLTLGCNSSAETSEFSGEWTCVSVEVMGVLCDADIIYEGKVPHIVIKDNGRASFTATSSTLRGTWEETEGGIAITNNGESMPFTYQDGQLSCIFHGTTAVTETLTLYFTKNN